MQMGQISEIETLLFFLAQTSQICLISISARKRTKTHENRLGCLEHYLASALQKARARIGKQRPGHGLGPVFSLPCLGKMDCNLQSGRPGPYFARGHLGAHESARKRTKESVVKTLRICDFVENIHWAPTSNENAPFRLKSTKSQKNFPISAFSPCLSQFDSISSILSQFAQQQQIRFFCPAGARARARRKA